MDRLQSMKAFEQVVAENGFAAGGRKLGLAPATVTRLVGDLEDHLGVRLLHRSTRRLALTTAGEAYLDRVRCILSEIDEAEEAARSEATAMSGCVRVLALPGMATHLVAPAVADFRRQHPLVRIELQSDALAVRGIEAHDITLLTDHVPIPAATVIRPVVRSQGILCASPDYVRRRGEPRTPADLLEHAVLRFVLPEVGHGFLQLVHESEENQTETVGVEPVVTCNDHEAVLRSTLEGAGISSQAIEVAAPLLQSGRLQRVLAPWLSERFTLVAAFASRRHMPARTRAFLEHLIQHAARAGAGTQSAAIGGRVVARRAGLAHRDG